MRWKAIVLALLLCVSANALSQENTGKVNDLVLGLHSEDMLLYLNDCLKQGEREGKYEACDKARNIYVLIKNQMSKSDTSKMDPARRIRIEKRMAIVESLQLK